MTISAEKLRLSALSNGCDDVFYFTPEYIDKYFAQNFVNPLLAGSRGYSWWIWKPYFLVEAMHSLADGEIVIYCDAGNTIVGDVRQVVDAMDQDIMFFSNGWQHIHWCKKEVATAINPVESKTAAYYLHKQVQASTIFFRVNETTKNFVKEWLAWAMMPGFVDNEPRGEQFPEFRESRHDQAILCCMQQKYGYKLHWFPAVMNQHQRTDEVYGTILDHHRLRNHQY